MTRSIQPVGPEGARIYAEDWLRPLDLERVFGNDHPVEVDLGSGKGRFLLARAAAQRDVNFLGIERMLSRVRKVARKIGRRRLSNVRVLRMEGYYATAYLLPPAGIRTLYILFPDPWPKKRHHAHRLFGPPFLDAVHRVLRPGGTLQAATDHLPYFEEIHALLRADPRFEEIAPLIPGEEEQTDFERYYVRHTAIGRCGFRKRPTG